MGKNFTKSQHWVPRFYLEHFAKKSSQGKLYVTDVHRFFKGNGVYIQAHNNPSKIKREPIEKIACIDYLYSDIESGELKNVLEDGFFQKMELEVGEIFKRCAEDNLNLTEDSDAQVKLALFAASLHLRNPRMVALTLGTSQEQAPLGPCHDDIKKGRNSEPCRAVLLTLPR